MRTKVLLIAALGLFLSASAVQAQNIRGRVVDEKGTPVAGAIVSYGNKQGLAADDNGEFSIDRTKAGSKLKVSYLGYKTQDVNLKKDASNVTVTLLEDQKALDDVVVVGYGTSTKEKLTGSVTTIDRKTLEQYSGRSVLDVLDGRIAGLYLTSTSGLPGAKANITVRGTKNISGGGAADACGCCGGGGGAGDNTYNGPLILIDGIPYTNESVGVLDIGSAGSTGPLAFLNTNDVERIDVLKDADATAIYGSRGANGVILITTKKGLLKQKTKV
ncbi:MAG: TonB-dependent receptor plug domain-containing protein [Dysgonamonadaceae bacterium]|jgi:iron complex outermembrane receptor protein|nr:TonB-dependent receptor plug domain-containing protein [Dysgonamonadaceae bacterium]